MPLVGTIMKISESEPKHWFGSHFLILPCNFNAKVLIGNANTLLIMPCQMPYTMFIQDYKVLLRKLAALYLTRMRWCACQTYYTHCTIGRLTYFDIPSNIMCSFIERLKVYVDMRVFLLLSLYLCLLISCRLDWTDSVFTE